MLERYVREVVTAPRSWKVRDVAQLMRDRGVGCVVVVDGARPVGIVTDRDVALRVVADGASTEDRVERVMTEDPVTASLHASIDVALRAMRRAGVRRLPIVDDAGRVTGIVTHDDLVLLLARELSDLGEGIEGAVDAPELR